MRTIFISHSSKSPEAIADLEAIGTGLTDAGFEIWLDLEALEAGDNWNQKIGNHLVYCQGAVVLVTKESLASPYVQFEIGNLLSRWRREYDPASGESTFPLCPVLLSPDVVDELGQGFAKAVHFTDVNYIGPCRADEAVSKLVDRFRKLPDFAEVGSPLANIERHITEVLLAERIPETLRDAAKTAGFPIPAGADDRAAALRAARSLLTLPLRNGYLFLAALGAAITNERRLNLFHLIAPGWVSPEAALTLAEVFAKPSPPPCILNAELAMFTPQMYLRRARLELPDLAGVAIGVKGATVSSAMQQLRHLIADALAREFTVDLSPSDPGFEKQLRTEIDWHFNNIKRPILVAVPVAESDLGLIAPLAAEPIFKGITFVAFCNTARPFNQSSSLKWLNPPLQPGQEISARDEHDRFMKRLPK